MHTPTHTTTTTSLLAQRLLSAPTTGHACRTAGLCPITNVHPRTIALREAEGRCAGCGHHNDGFRGAKDYPVYPGA